MQELPVIHELYQYVVQVAGYTFLAVMGWKAWQNYQEDNDVAFWKSVGWGFIAAGLIWQGEAMKDLFVRIWSNLLGG